MSKSDAYKKAAGCSPPLTDLSPEDAIRRGRGSDISSKNEGKQEAEKTEKACDCVLIQFVNETPGIRESFAKWLRLEKNQFLTVGDTKTVRLKV